MFTLRFPFTLPPGREVAVAETSGELAGLNYHLKKEDRRYVLTLSGFPTEEAAQAYVKNIRAAFLWVLLHTGIFIDATFEPQTVIYLEDSRQVAENLSKCFGIPIEGPVDALLDGGRPAVYATGKHVLHLTGGQATFILTTIPVETVIHHFAGGLAFEGITKVIDNPKLLLSLELHGVITSLRRRIMPGF